MAVLALEWTDCSPSLPDSDYLGVRRMRLRYEDGGGEGKKMFSHVLLAESRLCPADVISAIQNHSSASTTPPCSKTP